MRCLIATRETETVSPKKAKKAKKKPYVTPRVGSYPDEIVATMPRDDPKIAALNEMDAELHPRPEVEGFSQPPAVLFPPEPEEIEPQEVVEKRRQCLLETISGAHKVAGKGFELPEMFIEAPPHGWTVEVPSKPDFRVSITMTWGTDEGRALVADVTDTPGATGIRYRFVGGVWYLGVVTGGAPANIPGMVGGGAPGRGSRGPVTPEEALKRRASLMRKICPGGGVQVVSHF